MVFDRSEQVRTKPDEPFQSRLTITRTAGLAVVLLIYACFEFPAYLAGNVKYLGMAGLSVALMLTITAICFEGHFMRVLTFLASDRAAMTRRMLLLLILVLASVSHLNRILLDHHLYLQARIVSLPVNRIALGIYASFVILTLIMVVRPPRSATPIVLLALAWGIVIRILAISVPYTPDAADMLAAVNGACESLLHGVNPYSQTFNGFPLMYFPLLWLPYLPFKAVGIDIRWLNLLAQTGLYVFLWSLMRRRGEEGFRPFFLVFLVLVPDMVFSVSYRQVSLYWLLGAVFVWLLWREKWIWSAIAVSGLASMRLTAFTILWLYLIYVWKRRGLRIAGAHALIAVGVFLAFLAPFASVGLARLRYVFFGVLVEVAARDGWQHQLYALSMGGALGRIGLSAVRVPAQAIGVFLIGVLFMRSRDVSYGTLVRLAAFTYAFFLWISGFIAIYYWFTVVVLLGTLHFIEISEEKTELDGNFMVPASCFEEPAQNGVHAGQ
jgi:hypothetical protein